MQPDEPIDTTRSLVRLRDLRRRYLEEEADLLETIEDAQADLDSCHRNRRQLRLQGVSAQALDRVCEAIQANIIWFETDLIDTRSALMGLENEIADFEHRFAARLLADRVVDRRVMDNLHGRLILP